LDRSQAGPAQVYGAQAQGGGIAGARSTASRSAASCQRERAGGPAAGRGAVSRMKRSSAPMTAAASSSEAFGAISSSCGRRFTGRARTGGEGGGSSPERLPPDAGNRLSSPVGAAPAIPAVAHGAAPAIPAIVSGAVPTIPVLDHDAVLAAVSPAQAIERVRMALLRHHAGNWRMPAKVYLESPPYGDFRAMPALGDGLALLKWITSFPGNPHRGLPTVTGVVCLSDATCGELLMLLDARSVTALRTGAVAAVATRALARPEARAAGIIGCGLHGAWAARCLAAAGYGPGVCFDPCAQAARARAAELGWQAGSREQAAACEIVTCVTPGAEPVLDAGDLRPGQHLNLLGADGPGKAEMTLAALERCALFCDELEQASHGGELAGALTAGVVAPAQVGELGAVLAGEHPGRPGPEAITLFDSTGLAIQDLAVACAALEAYRAGRVQAQTVQL
jgi:alanine dehydrogenase